MTFGGYLRVVHSLDPVGSLIEMRLQVCIRDFAAGREDHPAAVLRPATSFPVDRMTLMPLAEGDDMSPAVAGRLQAERERTQLLAEIGKVLRSNPNADFVLDLSDGSHLRIGTMTNAQLVAWLKFRNLEMAHA